MAFCPNCGTPNTDQAIKCVSCSFELAPVQKAKFKGTIMMSGVQAHQLKPGQAAEPAKPESTAPVSTQPPSAQPTAAAPGRNMAFAKTMLGPMAAVPQVEAHGPHATAQGHTETPTHGASAKPGADLASAATLEGPAPQFTPATSQVEAPAPGHAGDRSSETPRRPSLDGGFGGGDPFGDPEPTKSKTGKVVAIGCAVALAVTCLMATIMFSMIKRNLFSSASDEETILAWRASLGQALNEVSIACLQQQCQGAEKFFHPTVENELLPQAKLISPERIAKLLDPSKDNAQMLNATDQTDVAIKLGLDPQLCVRVAEGTAQAVACSVPKPGGDADLRLVHLSGFESL